MATDLKAGDRVRLLVHVPPAEWTPGASRRDYPVGSLGRVVNASSLSGGYGVLLDDDPDQLPAHFYADEIESVDD